MDNYSSQITIGILGAGNICAKMAQTVNMMKSCRLGAVAARDKERAEAFAKRFGIPKAYGSYEEFLNDPEIDLVYVGTITSLHKQHMVMCLEHGKHVLCEKAFTVNRQEAEEVFALAKAKKLLVAEAIWPRYMPFRKKMCGIIDSNRIGRLTSITANLAYRISEVPRIYDPALGGGVMLDLSVYPLNFALMALGEREIKEYSGSCVKNSKGADMKEMLNFITEDDVQVSIFTDSYTNSDRRGIIYGTDGYIEVDNVNNPARLDLYTFDKTDGPAETLHFKHEATGFEYQVESCISAIRENRTEVPEMDWNEILRVLSIMDRYRSMFDVRIASEM